MRFLQGVQRNVILAECVGSGAFGRGFQCEQESGRGDTKVPDYFVAVFFAEQCAQGSGMVDP